MANAAVEAAISAIEIYNKPDFRYREETFAILMINAWELLLKGKILYQNDNSMNAIYSFGKAKKSDGTTGKKRVLRRNRSGNPTTIEFTKAAYIVSNYVDGIDDRCLANLLSLMEIRDNSIHFINKEASIAQRVQEVGTASLQNFLTAAQSWFDIDVSKYNFYLMPIHFRRPTDFKSAIEKGSFNTETSNLLNFIASEEKQHPADSEKIYNVSLNVEVRFVKSKAEGATPVKLSKEAGAQPVYFEEKDVFDKYPHDFSDLIAEIKKHTEFKRNRRFWDLKREKENNPNNCFVRRLDPNNPNSSRKAYYSQSMVNDMVKEIKALRANGLI